MDDPRVMLDGPGEWAKHTEVAASAGRALAVLQPSEFLAFMDGVADTEDQFKTLQIVKNATPEQQKVLVALMQCYQLAQAGVVPQGLWQPEADLWSHLRHASPKSIRELAIHLRARKEGGDA